MVLDRFEKLDLYSGLKLVLSDENSWPFIYSVIDDIGECFLDGGELYMSSPKYFKTPDDFTWIAGFVSDKLCLLALIHRYPNEIDLVVVEKRHIDGLENCFGQLLEFLKTNHQNSTLKVFPANEWLEEYYLSKGFKPSGSGDLYLNI